MKNSIDVYTIKISDRRIITVNQLKIGDSQGSFMCTLMEKDVLIEEVSAVAAYIGYRFIGELPDELIRIAAINDYLYSSDPEQIDAEQIREEIASLKKIILTDRLFY